MLYDHKRGWDRIDVDVVALHFADGVVMPIELRWADGRSWKLVCRAPGKRGRAEHVAGDALVYPVDVILPSGARRSRKLYYDFRHGKWFIERYETLEGRPLFVDTRTGAEYFAQAPNKCPGSICFERLCSHCVATEMEQAKKQAKIA